MDDHNHELEGEVSSRSDEDVGEPYRHHDDRDRGLAQHRPDDRLLDDAAEESPARYRSRERRPDGRRRHGAGLRVPRDPGNATDGPRRLRPGGGLAPDRRVLWRGVTHPRPACRSAPSEAAGGLTAPRRCHEALARNPTRPADRRRCDAA